MPKDKRKQNNMANQNRKQNKMQTGGFNNANNLFETGQELTQGGAQQQYGMQQNQQQRKQRQQQQGPENQ